MIFGPKINDLKNWKIQLFLQCHPDQFSHIIFMFLAFLDYKGLMKCEIGNVLFFGDSFESKHYKSIGRGSNYLTAFRNISSQYRVVIKKGTYTCQKRSNSNHITYRQNPRSKSKYFAGKDSMHFHQALSILYQM